MLFNKVGAILNKSRKLIQDNIGTVKNILHVGGTLLNKYKEHLPENQRRIADKTFDVANRVTNLAGAITA